MCVCVSGVTRAIVEEIFFFTWKRSIGSPKNWKMTLERLEVEVGLLRRTEGSEMKATVPSSGQLLMNT